MERRLQDYRFFRTLCAMPPVEAIWLFGSRAQGLARERSDIDLAVLCPAATAAEWARMRALVEEEADTLLGIDLVRLDSLAPDSALRAAILRDGRPVFERARA